MKSIGLVLFVILVCTACSNEQTPSSIFATTFFLSSSESIPNSAPIKIEKIHTEPVLKRGNQGTWDHVDLLNPSVVRFKDNFVNYYSGFDGQIWRTGIATSKDGITWDKYSGNPVLEPKPGEWDVKYIAANGSAVVHGGKVLYFYQGVDKTGRIHIGLAIAEDGFHFKRHPTPVLSAGAPHTWESKAVADPYVIEKDGYLYIYYLGQDDLGVQRLGIARSKNGLSWDRLPSNPVLDVGAAGAFDENGLGEPSIAYQAPYFYMLYTGRDTKEVRNIGYAISTDGTHWKKMNTTGLITDKLRSAWFSKVICDTTLMPSGNGKWMVWFGGGDKPEPAQLLNGQVGLMTLDLEQNRDMTGFDANNDWSKSYVKSTDALRGSYELEGEAGKRSTWLGPISYTTLTSDKSVAGKTLTFEGWVPAKTIATAIKQTGSQTISIIARRKVIAKQIFIQDDIFSLTVPWSDIEPLIGIDGTLDLEINSDRSFIPSQHIESKDSRNLALILYRIRFQ